MDNKNKLIEYTFELGEIVCERVRPNQKLIIMQRTDKIYYCVPQENPKRKPLFFHEHDLRVSF